MRQIRRAITASKGCEIRVKVASLLPPREGQICIKVAATALNFSDHLLINGTYQDMPEFPLTPGMEFSGVVDSIAPDVADFAPGMRVVAVAGHGGLAEFTNVDAVRAVALPDTIDHNSAAAMPIAYSTAHLALSLRGGLSFGKTLIVLGATGGVGLAAIEVGKALGASVVAVARGANRLASAQAAGADVTIDTTTTPDLYQTLKSLAPADVVFDSVGGADGETAQRCLKPEGRHLLIGFASGDLPRLKPNHLLVKNIDVIGFNLSGYWKFNSKAIHSSLQTLLDWHADGKIQPQVSQVFTLNQTREALDLLKSRKSTGKIIVTP
ncbi:MAG: zinc-binding dehydrogenase [Boseongicola sp.]|nr:MAG: zinc-binding dehydrogenase [Boseongicola sp.]